MIYSGIIFADGLLETIPFNTFVLSIRSQKDQSVIVDFRYISFGSWPYFSLLE